MTLIARVEHADGRVQLRAPSVGLWREAPRHGALIAPGASLGRIELLGTLIDVVAPEGAHGIVVDSGGDPGRARRPLGYDDLMLVLDPEVAGVALAPAERAADTASGDAFVAPTSGRFYVRPSPDRDPFVAVGDIVRDGDPIGLLEVMKTFNRIHYSGAEARVTRIVPADGDDIEAGDRILEIEPV